MVFDYNYGVCLVCENKMNYCNDPKIMKCSNGCCRYDIDLESETVYASIFDGNTYLLELYEKSYKSSFASYSDLRANINDLLSQFIKEVYFWRENDRYLMRIMTGEKNG